MQKALRTLTRVAALLFLFFIAAGDGVSAAGPEACKIPEMRIDERPSPEEAPTLVSVGFWLIDLTKIDDIDQKMTIDIMVFQSWKDSRLEGLEGCRFALSDIWSPQLDFDNSGRVFPGMPERVTIGSHGAVEYTQRYRGALSFPHRLDFFPFDSYVARIALGSLEYMENQVRLVVDTERTGRRTKRIVSVTDWTIGTPTGHVVSREIEEMGVTRSMFVYEIPTERLPGYFVWKVVLPLILIVAMSWTVFWISPVYFGPQIGMSATAMLTLIAFQFAMASILPKLSYFTLLDRFIMLSTVLVFLGLVESLTTAYLVTLDKKAFALKIDRVCRWAFPLAFAVILAATFVF